MNIERDELAKFIEDEAHVDWFSGSARELAESLIAAGYRKERLSAWDLLGVAPQWTGGMSTDEYMDEQRGRGEQ